MKKLGVWFLLVLVLPIFAGDAVDKKELDRKAILAHAGTFVVDFHFKETAAFEMGYELKPTYDSAALETVVVVEDREDKIVLQHVLQTKRGVIKHWRQDWEYENTEVWEYQGDRVWKKRQLSSEEAKGTWTQRVFQVDDSPRYESVGRWVHVGNLAQWESEHTNRPLPRREYTKRDDYNILVAKNRQAVTPTGWVHEQDNFKLRKSAQAEHVIAREFGLNRYDRTQPEKVAEAAEWWGNHKMFWADVRSIWDGIFVNQNTIALRPKVDGKPMYRHLFDLSEEAGKVELYDSTVFKARAAEIITKFMTSQDVVTKASKNY